MSDPIAKPVSPLRKYALMVLRIFLAIGGVAYIGYSIDWTDKVEVHEGTMLPSSATLPEGLRSPRRVVLPVIAGHLNPKRQEDPLTLDASSLQPGASVTIAATDLSDPDRYLLRASFISTFRYANKWMLLLGLAMVAPVYPIQTYRWLMLLRARGISVTYGNALRLTMIGNFFNFCMPGATGGDVIKAYYAAKGAASRSDSIMTVLFDRLAGLVGLAILAGLVGLFILDDALARHITIYVWLGMAAAGAGAAVYFSRRLRRWLGLSWLLSMMPLQGLLTKIDNAAVAYRSHKRVVAGAVLISLPVHLLLAAATAIAGYAMGMDTRLGLVLTVVPVIFLSGALPITPQGAGVWEALGRAMLYQPPMVTMNHIVAMLIMIRLYQLAFSLIGSVYLLRGDVRLHPEELPEAAGN